MKSRFYEVGRFSPEFYICTFKSQVYILLATKGQRLDCARISRFKYILANPRPFRMLFGPIFRCV